MRSLPANSIDLAFADPPFNIGYEYDIYQDRQGDREYLDWSKQWLIEVQRLLKPHGTLWIAIGDEYAAELKASAGLSGRRIAPKVCMENVHDAHC